MEYNKAEQLFKLSVEFNKGKIDKSSESIFITEMQQMVTILKENNRIKEAEDIISKSSFIIKDPRFKMAMESILTD